MADIDSAKLKEAVFAVIEEKGLDNLTQKQVQRLAEEKLGLEEKTLKSHKSEVSALIDKYIEAHANTQNDAEEEVEEEEEEEAPPPKKSTKRTSKKVKEEDEDDFDDDEDEEEEAPKRKKAKKEPEEKEVKEKTFTVETASGEECPKKIKDLQMKATTKSKFCANAPEMEIELWGNKLTGKPRSFASGNMGWYSGGKVEFKVGGKTMWGSIGINLVVMGSKDWKK